MSKRARIHVGNLKPEDIKVRKSGGRPTQVQKSPKDYDRKKLKQQDRKEGVGG